MILSLLRKRARPKAPATEAKIWPKTHIDIDGVDVPVIIVENARSERLTLRIMTGGKELRLSVPPHTPYRHIDQFLQKHRQWVAKKLALMPKVHTIADGTAIQLRGVPHLIVHQGRGRGLVKPVERDGQWQLDVHGDIRHLSRRVVDYLKKQARSDLHLAVSSHADNLGVKAKSITLRDTTSRWGSCSSRGALSFSWRIIMAPPDILDYLAAHEVAHLRQMNHSPDFWELVAETCPHAKTSRAWLKTHGTVLHALLV